jgi:hypothetical protein
MNSYTAWATFSESVSVRAFAAGRAARRLYRSLLGVDTAPGALHGHSELITVEGITF